MLGRLDAPPQRRGRVARLDRDGHDADHGPRVDALVDPVHGRGRLGHACGEDVLDRVGAGEGGERRGVGVDDPRREDLEEARAAAGACSPRARRGSTPRSRARAPSPRHGRPGSRRHRREDRGRDARSPRRGERRDAGPLEATATIGSPASMSAWRFVPSPLTSTPIMRRLHPPRPRRPRGARSRGRRGPRRPAGRPRSSRCPG